jgi:hypothetical protein
MCLTPGELLVLALVAAFTVIMPVAVFRLYRWYSSRTPPRLRLLSGTRSQQAAIVLAVRPVVRELLPSLEAAGLEVSSIALLPTLAGSAGEPLQAQVEQVNGTRAFSIRLAHTVAGTLRRPEEISGALAEEFLDLYRNTAAVTIVRETPAAIPATPLASTEAVGGGGRGGRSGVAPLPRAAVKQEAEETVIAFKASPLGREAPTRNGA